MIFICLNLSNSNDKSTNDCCKRQIYIAIKIDKPICKIYRIIINIFIFINSSNYLIYLGSKEYKRTYKYLSKDADLVKKLQNPALKDTAFSELLDAYQERLYWHIRKIVSTHENADDVLQNTFIRIYKNIKKFEGKSSLHTWMYRIAYNESIRFLENNNKKRYEDIDAVSESHLEVLFEDEYFDGDEIQKKLTNIIARFTEKQQRVFQMKYFDDLSFRKISEILEVSESTLKSTYYTTVKIIEEKIFL
jgi:RNA polymerase sigma factor (sigma-70 family)